MKQQHQLDTLLTELQQQQRIKRDFRSDTRALAGTIRFADDTSTLRLAIKTPEGGNAYDLLETAHRQLAARVKIPWTYYDRMRQEAPNLLATNLNHWLQNAPDVFTVRTLGTNARAVLGKAYRIIDHLELLSAMLPVIKDKYPDMRLDSIGLTDDRMYIKAVLPRLTREVRVGDPVQAGVVITNSETGDTALRIEPLVFRLVCSNGMIQPDNAFKRRHVGVRANVAEGESVEYQADTIAADNRALILKARDSMDHILTDEAFSALVDRMQQATQREVSGSPIAAVREVTRDFNFTIPEHEDILKHFLGSQDMTQYGLANAITRAAQDVPSYARSTELETVGYEVLTLPLSRWTGIARASDTPMA